jgi:hypothetical protein
LNDLQDRTIRAAEAKQFMENPLFKAMFAGVEEYLRQVGLHCEPDNKEKAHRVVITMQLLESLRMEIERRANDGDFAAFAMAEFEKQSITKRLFRR